jgi:hypothetical protein
LTEVFKNQTLRGLASLEIADNLLKLPYGLVQLLPRGFRQARHGRGERVDAALARFPHEAHPFWGCFEADAATVFCGVAADESGALEAGDDAAHRGGADLFRIGKFAKRLWTAEDENGKGGKLGRADTALAVANAKSAKEVNGGGVELVSKFESRQVSLRDGFGRRRRRRGCCLLAGANFALDRRHRR